MYSIASLPKRYAFTVKEARDGGKKVAAVVLTSLSSLSKYSAADKAIRSLLKLITTLKRESRERERRLYEGEKA